MSTELFKAIEDHDLNRVAEQLLQGADPDSTRSEWPEWRPLHAGIEELEYGGPIEVLTLLIQHGATIDGWDAQHDSTPLLMAVFRGQGAAVRLLLDSGADPNVRSSEGDSPLRWCVEQQDRDMAALLLHFGAGETINEFGGPRGLTALGIAADQFNIPMIELLLDGGADPDALDEDYKTARERLPPRQQCDPQEWDRAMDWLSRKGT